MTEQKNIFMGLLFNTIGLLIAVVLVSAITCIFQVNLEISALKKENKELSEFRNSAVKSGLAYTNSLGIVVIRTDIAEIITKAYDEVEKLKKENYTLLFIAHKSIKTAMSVIELNTKEKP